MMLKDVAARLQEHDIEIEVTGAAMDLLAKEGFDENYGARPLRRAIQRQVEDRLSEEMLRGTFKKSGKVIVDVSDHELVLRNDAS
jgi:ATP-dependent Clp protease ATP-binding subunit ClpC